MENIPQAPVEPNEKKSYALWLIIPAVMILAGLGYWAYLSYFQDKMPDTALETSDQTADAQNISKIDWSYLMETYGEGRKTTIMSFNSDFSEPNTTIFTESGAYINISGPYTDKGTYVGTMSKDGEGQSMVVLDLNNKKIDKLFSMSPENGTRAVSLSNSKKLLAYGVNFEGRETAGEIWLYDIETKEQTKIIDRQKLSLYQGFSIMGWSEDDSTLIVNALGGDAGAIWGEFYKVDVEARKITQLKSPKENGQNFLRSSLSPDAKYLLYSECDNPQGEGDALDLIYDYVCSEGEKLKLYDISTQTVKVLYQNLRYSDNTDKGILRKIGSSIWLNSDSAVIAVPGAFIQVDIVLSNSKVIYEFDGTNPQQFDSSVIELIKAEGDWVAYRRYNSGQGVFVLDIKTRKTLDINQTLPEAYFSSFVSQ